MPKFAYSAIDATGAEIEGTTKADTIGTARSMLVEKNLFPIRIEESRGMFDFELTKEKAKKKNLMNFTRQLSVFVKAGIPITDALTDDRRRVDRRRHPARDHGHGRRPSQRWTAVRCRGAVPAGVPELLHRHPPGGRADRSSRRVARLAGAATSTVRSRRASKVVGALAYPLVVMVLAMFTVMILAGYVLPQFKPLFEELERRPAAADADDAVRRPVLHRPLVHHGDLRPAVLRGHGAS